MSLHKKALWSIAVSAVMVFLVPIILFWAVIGRVSGVSATEAQALVSSGKAVLVDLRSAEAYRQLHVTDAVHWPTEDIMALNSSDGLPENLRGRQLLLVCGGGISSAVAAEHLQKLGVADAASVDGGMVSFGFTDKGCCSLELLGSVFAGDKPIKDLAPPLYEQLALCITAFGVKPFYMTLSVLIALVLRRSRSLDLRVLKWAMLVFFVGEGACAVNYLAFNLQSHFWEYAHNMGMVFAFSLMAYALFEALDLRVFHLTNPESRCALQGLCRSCTQRTTGVCGLERIFLIMAIGLWITSWMPLTATLSETFYTSNIFGTPYTAGHPVIDQVFEIRYCPTVALILFGACVLILAFKRTNRVYWSKIVFSMAMGPFLFSFFRLLVIHVYRDDPLWFDIWEEVLEGLLIMGIALSLSFFRASLFSEEASRAAHS